MSGARANGAAQHEVVHVRRDEALQLWVPEALPESFDGETFAGEGPLLSRYSFVATTEHTGGSLTGVTIDVPPGNGTPPHAHPDADESFFVLDGTFSVSAGDRDLQISSGDFVFVPRGTQHRWRNASGGTARMLLIYTPSDMERFFRAAGREVQPGEGPQRLTPEDARRAADAARREFGPPAAFH